MPPGTQAITRALQILQAFDDDHPTWELPALVEALSLNKTTVFRMLSALEESGMVEKTESGAYRLGSEVIALGGRAARANPLRRAASPHLQALTKLTGETTTLEVIRQENGSAPVMLVIDEVLGRHLVGITQYIGTRLPLHATSTARAILAFQPHETRQALLGFPMKALTDQTPTTRETFEAAIEATQARGYSVVIGEMEEGVIAVGAPVFNHNGDPIAAISLVGPSVRLRREEAHKLAADVQSTAADISYDIGYRTNNNGQARFSRWDAYNKTSSLRP